MSGQSNYRPTVSNPSNQLPSMVREDQGLSQQNHQNSSISQVDHGQTSPVIPPPRNLENEVDSLRFDVDSMSKTMADLKQHLNNLHAHFGLPLIDFNASDIASQMENALSTLASTTNVVDATKSTQQASSGERAPVGNSDNKAITGNLDDDTDSGPALVDPTKSVVQYPENGLASSQASSTDKMNHLGAVLNPLTEASHLPHTEEVANLGSTANAHDMLQEKTSMVEQKAFYSDIAKIGNGSPSQSKRSTPDQSHVHALPTTPIQQAKGFIKNSKPGNNKQSDSSTTKQVVQSGGTAEQDSNKRKSHQESTLADDYTVPRTRKLAPPRAPSSMERALAAITSEISMEHLILLEPSASPSQQGKVTPSKRATEKRKGSSSSKKSRLTKKSTFSSATKKQDLIDDTDFQAQQDEVTKFDKGIREVIGEYVVFMAENSKESRFTTPDGSQTLLDEILSSTIQMSSESITPFALACFSSRLASYSSRSDMENQKMRALLKAIRENGSSSIIKQDFNFLFGIKRTRDEHMDIESRYRTMLEEFDDWKPVPKPAVAKSSPELGSKQYFKDFIEPYSLIMGWFRKWRAVYRTERKTSNEFYNIMTNYIDKRRHLINNETFDDASVDLENRIENYRNSNAPRSYIGENFFTALYEFESEVVQEDIIFLFNVSRTEEVQEQIEVGYMDMILTFGTWNKFTLRSGLITRTEVETNPVKLPEKIMIGFINHINSQFMLRNNLKIKLDSADPCNLKESAMQGAYKSLFLEARSFTLANCRKFLAERVKLLSADPTSHHKCQERLYEFLTHVDSSIVIFDTYFFKKCIEEESVPQGFGLNSDEEYLNQMFRINK